MAPVAVPAAVPAKIVMRGNSIMSLNDRFSSLPPQPPVVKRELNISNGNIADEETTFTARLDIADFNGRSSGQPQRPQRSRTPFQFVQHDRDGFRGDDNFDGQSLAPPRIRSNNPFRSNNDMRRSPIKRYPVKRRLGAKGRLGPLPRDQAAVDLSLDELLNQYDWLSFRNARYGFSNRNFNNNNRGFTRRRFGSGGWRPTGFRPRRFNSTPRWNNNGYARPSRGRSNFGRQQSEKTSPVSKDILDREIDAYMAKTKLLETDGDVSMADLV